MDELKGEKVNGKLIESGDCIIVGRRLSWSIIFLIAMQFASIIWFARGLESRLSSLENLWAKNEPAISRLDVIDWRQTKMGEVLEKMRESQVRQETVLAELQARVADKK